MFFSQQSQDDHWQEIETFVQQNIISLKMKIWVTDMSIFG